MKTILYTLDYAGVDGREKPQVAFASYDEAERDDTAKQNPYLCCPSERIVDPDLERQKAFEKLGYLGRFFLGMEEK